MPISLCVLQQTIDSTLQYVDQDCASLRLICTDFEFSQQSFAQLDSWESWPFMRTGDVIIVLYLDPRRAIVLRPNNDSAGTFRIITGFSNVKGLYGMPECAYDYETEEYEFDVFDNCTAQECQSRSVGLVTV